MTEPRRLGDAVAIPGDYQHRALTEGPPVQRAWHRAKLDLLDWLFPIAKGERVLDVGSGSGVFADAIASRGASVVAVDANADAVAYATRTFARPGLEFRRGYLDEIELPPGSFDAAVCLEVIEHVHPPQVRKLLTDLHALLAPRGRLLVTTPNYRGLWPAVEWAADRFGSVAKMDQDQHVTRFDRRMLRAFLEEAGFEVSELRTYSTFAPFAAAVSGRISRRIDRLERRVDLPFGNLLAAVAIRRG